MNQDILLDTLFAAHYKSCFRDNPSSIAVVNAAAGSGDLSKAIAAGLLTLGGKHAPLAATVRLLSEEHPEQAVVPLLTIGAKIPGWGGTFQKDNPDPIWIPVDETLRAGWPLLANKLDDVTRVLHHHQIHIFPNPSAYTACVGIITGLNATTLFIRGRLNGWYELAAKFLTD